LLDTNGRRATALENDRLMASPVFGFLGISASTKPCYAVTREGLATRALSTPMVDTDFARDKVVLITGAAGTIGSALAEKLLPLARAVRCFDHAETELFFLNQRLKKRGALAPQLGDIRDLDRLRFAMAGVDIVMHTAALKHVALGEYNPFEVVQTNLQGLNNIIRAALDADVERVVFTSSDKAVNPTNVMGASKMMGERLIIAANEIRGHKRTRFAAVRFGNVIGSRGSVVPIFAGQLLRGDPLTITDDQMSRYVMTIDEAADLVLDAGSRMLGGEVFVTKMRALNVVDLAAAMARRLDVKRYEIVNIGARAGEKLYEELVTDDEMARAKDLERLLVVLPAEETEIAAMLSRHYASNKAVSKEWHSGKDHKMSVDEIVAYLDQHRILHGYLTPGGLL
jgi:UDP-N-acetylglucosamine 4,6-dehydratase/5-epimerase